MQPIMQTVPRRGIPGYLQGLLLRQFCEDKMKEIVARARDDSNLSVGMPEEPVAAKRGGLSGNGQPLATSIMSQCHKCQGVAGLSSKSGM